MVAIFVFEVATFLYYGGFMELVVGKRIRWRCHLGNEYEGVISRVMSNVVEVENDRGQVRFVRRENIIKEIKKDK